MEEPFPFYSSICHHSTDLNNIQKPLIHSFIHSSINSFIHSFTHSSIHVLNRLRHWALEKRGRKNNSLYPQECRFFVFVFRMKILLRPFLWSPAPKLEVFTHQSPQKHVSHVENKQVKRFMLCIRGSSSFPLPGSWRIVTKLEKHRSHYIDT